MYNVLDDVAETLETLGESDLAAYVDKVAYARLPEVVLAVVDEVADALETRNSTLVGAADAIAYGLAQRTAFEVLKGNPDDALTSSAGEIAKAVGHYGVKGYAVRGTVVDITVERGQVETVATLGFVHQEGEQRLRVAFRCGEDQMVRWARLPRVDTTSLVTAVNHVFATGEDYDGQA